MGRLLANATVLSMRSSSWSPALMPRAKPSGRPMTLADWADLAEDEPGELVEGRLVEEEVPNFFHELVVTWLAAVIRPWLKPRRGYVLGSELKLRITERTGRKPDLGIYLTRASVQGDASIQRRMPDIVIEVVSPKPRDQRRDRVEKMTDYARAGVRWYWLLDPALGSFEIFELTDRGRYTRVLAATEGVVVDIPGCAELTVDLDELWSELEAVPSRRPRRR